MMNRKPDHIIYWCVSPFLPLGKKVSESFGVIGWEKDGKLRGFLERKCSRLRYPVSFLNVWTEKQKIPIPISARSPCHEMPFYKYQTEPC